MMDRDNITRTGARAPGVERQQSLAWWCLATQQADGSERRPTRCERRARRMEANRGLVTGMPGAGLTGRDCGKALSETPALEPYWGKPAVRNLREENGNVGIIRSLVRAIVLPDSRPNLFSRVSVCSERLATAPRPISNRCSLVEPCRNRLKRRCNGLEFSLADEGETSKSRTITLFGRTGCASMACAATAGSDGWTG